MRRIEIDEDVYAVLESNVKGFEQPNDVLRRLLLGSAGSASDSAPPAPRVPKEGALYWLVERGVIVPGDELVHVRRRAGQTVGGHVNERGLVVTQLGEYPSPSPALKDLVGTEISGWAFWVHVRSGKSLRQLREENPV